MRCAWTSFSTRRVVWFPLIDDGVRFQTHPLPTFLYLEGTPQSLLPPKQTFYLVPRHWQYTAKMQHEM